VGVGSVGRRMFLGEILVHDGSVNVTASDQY
jgi:hypothetical protein